VLQTAIAFSLSGNRQGEHVPIVGFDSQFPVHNDACPASL
jgi:hypothetical protein